MAILVGTPAALPPCPDKPNCVSTQATDPRHAIAPIVFSGSSEAAMAKLVAVIRAMPRTKIVSQDAGTMRVEFTTRIMRYVDDVTFAIDDAGKVIHFRSASRVGHSDFGVNRRRMEEVRERFAK